MKDGLIRVAAAAPQIRVADCAANAQAIIDVLGEAAGQGAKLLVLPELCLTGYTCGDLFLQQTLRQGAIDALSRIMEASAAYETILCVGLPISWQSKCYNCCAVIYRGELLGVVAKTHLPNYGEFQEERYFCAAPEKNTSISLLGRRCPFGARLIFACNQLPELRLAVEICEDLWVPAAPSASHAAAGATVLANLSASDEVIGKQTFRQQLVTSHSARTVSAYIYADAGEGESTTDLVFSGHHLIAENGSLLAENAPFAGGILYSEVDVMRIAGERQRLTTYPAPDLTDYDTITFDMQLTATQLTRRIDRLAFVPSDEAVLRQRCEQILEIQAHGLKKRLAHSGSRCAVIGISGGLDSCLALLVTVRAMDLLGRSRQEIVAVTMPCFGTTKRTKGNAWQLCEALGVQLREIDIKASVQQHFQDMGHDADDLSVVYENAQARERTQLLMDIANQHGGMVIGTGDLSELALGWATYNGDHMSMYGVNASVPKTLVRHLVRYAAETAENPALKDVLLDILDTPVSPELLPAKDGEIAQKTEELVGPYELHDFFLYYMLRFGFSPAKIFRLCRYAFAGEYDDATIAEWLGVFYRRFFSQQFKRSCLPDGPKVGTVTLSPRGDWRMPSDACAALWLRQVEELKSTVVAQK